MMDLPLWSEGASPWPPIQGVLAVRSPVSNRESDRAGDIVESIVDGGSVNEIGLPIVSPAVPPIEIHSIPGALVAT